jgi:hypothetical protein
VASDISGHFGLKHTQSRLPPFETHWKRGSRRERARYVNVEGEIQQMLQLGWVQTGCLQQLPGLVLICEHQRLGRLSTNFFLSIFHGDIN